MAVSNKVIHPSTVWPRSSILNIYLRNENIYLLNNFNNNVLSTFIHNSFKLEMSQISIIKTMGKKWYIQNVEYYPAIKKKKWTTDVPNNMEWTSKTLWWAKVCILYDPIYMKFKNRPNSSMVRNKEVVVCGRNKIDCIRHKGTLRWWKCSKPWL